MRVFLIVIISFFSSALLSQNYSESDIKELAKKLDRKKKGVDLGNGITIRGCLAAGRTLIYQYNVPDNWEPYTNIKDTLISNLKTAGNANPYFVNNIDIDYYYYKENSLVKKVNINSEELSNYSLELGEYVSTKGHKKSKGVNLKLRVPNGWEVMEADRPNIVKKFTNGNNAYLIMVKHNMTFFSRSESRELFNDQIHADELIKQVASTLVNPKVIDKSVVTIDSYPAITVKLRGNMERLGFKFPIIMRCWIIYYEDKLVLFQSIGVNSAEYEVLKKLYFLITNSVVFPEQYD